ncbi:MAG: helix-turn-helix transcriptional regulator [Acidiferrobacterales bacterium]|nr:helix-turn-helix transcriptional regulator [Acidiferrobacterales bacterium]
MGFLALYFAASGLSDIEVILAPILSGYVSPVQLEILAILMLPIGIVAAPMLWFYILAITQSSLPTRQSIALHLLPFLLLSLATCWFLSLPFATKTAVIFQQAPELSALASLCLSVLESADEFSILIWLAYVIPITSRVYVHSRSLRDHFSSTDGRELTWVTVLAVLYCCGFVFYFLGTVLRHEGEPFGWIDLTSSVLALLLIAWASFFGLKQRPSLIPNISTDSPTETNTKKYQKSALSDVDCARIAQKLEHAMQEEHLYRNADLSLAALSEHIGVSTNYLSQTLNEHLQKSFFEYVNHWRIKTAIPLLSTKDKTVLDVAYEVGFNSRSAFYRAYKKETGTTPGRNS